MDYNPVRVLHIPSYGLAPNRTRLSITSREAIKYALLGCIFTFGAAVLTLGIRQKHQKLEELYLNELLGELHVSAQVVQHRLPAKSLKAEMRALTVKLDEIGFRNVEHLLVISEYHQTPRIRRFLSKYLKGSGIEFDIASIVSPGDTTLDKWMYVVANFVLNLLHL